MSKELQCLDSTQGGDELIDLLDSFVNDNGFKLIVSGKVTHSDLLSAEHRLKSMETELDLLAQSVEFAVELRRQSP